MDDLYQGDPWVQTWSGGALSLLNPTADQVVLDDIVHALDGVPRYNAHTTRPYSVLEHSVHVSVACEAMATVLGLGPVEIARVALGGLLHDVAEAYMGDPTYPLLVALGPEAYKRRKVIAHGIERAIIEALGLDDLGLDLEAPVIREIDKRMVHSERKAVLAPCRRAWPTDRMKPPLDYRISASPARMNWRHVFRHRLETLPSVIRGAE